MAVNFEKLDNALKKMEGTLKSFPLDPITGSDRIVFKMERGVEINREEFEDIDPISGFLNFKNHHAFLYIDEPFANLEELKEIPCERGPKFHIIKECVTLQKNGYDMNLVIADGLGNETKYDVKIIDVGKPINRFSRIFITTIKVFLKAKKLDADIYHFHDPELAPICLFFRLLGKPVIFDVHENIGEQIKDKQWLSPVFANLFSFLFSFLYPVVLFFLIFRMEL